jgi:dimethylargininase
VCAPLGDDRITLAHDMPRDGFGSLAIIAIPAEETYAANVLAVGDVVLAAEGYPRSHAALAAAGFRVVPLATTEFRKADGALTCLSILI